METGKNTTAIANKGTCSRKRMRRAKVFCEPLSQIKCCVHLNCFESFWK